MRMSGGVYINRRLYTIDIDSDTEVATTAVYSCHRRWMHDSHVPFMRPLAVYGRGQLGASRSPPPYAILAIA